MRIPTRSMVCNLRWTRSGMVWADWILTGLPYGLRPTKDKHIVRTLHQALIRALPGESLLLGVCSGLDPAAVVEKMLDGVDLAACPEWAAECEATLESLDEIGPGQRIHWLSVPLGVDRPSDRALEPLRAATADLRDRLGLPRAAVPVADVERRLAQAARIADSIPGTFRPTAATPAQMVWLHQHAIRRGLFQDLDLPGRASDDVAASLLTPKSSSALGEPLLDEGGQSDLEGKPMTRWNPLSRRYLKVQDSGSYDGSASYQSLLVISDVPDGGMVFPGSEVIGRIDESGLDVDWAIRLHVQSSAQVASQNQRALRNLNEQYGQRSGELSHGLNMLDRVAHDLAEYVAILENDKLEVETQAAVIFCVAGPDAAAATNKARALTDFLADTGYKLVQPLGYQEELWWAMTPGVPSTRAVREFAQITPSKALAATVPLASTNLGDTKGSLLALNIAHGPLFAPNVPCGPTSVILHDAEGSTDKDVSGSLAIAGELGSGKALSLDTPIATPSGWTSMGDLLPGHEVFDEHGHPTTVLAVSPVMRGHVCYRVLFSDGSTVVADAEHLWVTWDRVMRAAYDRMTAVGSRGYPSDWATWSPPRSSSNPYRPGERDHMRCLRGQGMSSAHIGELIGRTAIAVQQQWTHPEPLPTTNRPRTTTEIARRPNTSGANNHGIPATSPLQLPEADLPLEPYVMGYLLGDGDTKGTGRIACHPDDRRWLRSEFARCGYSTREHADPGHFSVPKLSATWRSLSLHNGKHIPLVYLRASVGQRLALAQGLVDSDGYVDAHGSYRFTTTSEELAEGFISLVVSLGCIPHVHTRAKTRRGQPSKSSWEIVVSSELPLARIPRKASSARQRWNREQKTRYIVAVEQIPSTIVRCITVDSPSHIFLAGRAMIPTHNSVTLKKLSGDVIDRGGRVVAADRTAMGEWAVWARSVTRAVIVDIADPALSLDPLRLFGPRAGSRITQTFLTPLLNVSPTSERGVLLSDILDPEYLSAHHISGLGQLLSHLQRGCELPGAAEMARLINVFARRDFGRVIFDESVPALKLSDPAVIIRTHTLMLPSREELEHQHLFEQLGLEKIFGRAMYALIAAFARHVCFAEQDVLGLFVVDEAHSVTISPEGEREIVDFVRDGRKHRAAVALGSHDPEADFGSPTLRGLIPTRILMRHRDKTLAQRGLAWLDLDPTDDSLVDLVRQDMSPVLADGVAEHRRGECLIRDTSGNVGRGKILMPAVQTRRLAVRTSGPAGGSPPTNGAST